MEIFRQLVLRIRVEFRRVDLAVGAEGGLAAYGEIDHLPVGRPLRGGATSLRSCDESHIASIRTHRIDLIILIVPVGCECNHIPVRRPCRPAVKRSIVRDISGVGPVSISYEHLRVGLAKHSAECHPLPIGRPNGVGVNTT